MCDWRETLLFNDCYREEKIILNYEKSRKELVDALKAGDERASKGQKGDEERKRGHEKLYQDWQNKFKDFDPGKDNSDYKFTPPNSGKDKDKIAQLKKDIEELRGNVDNPKLTEKEKAVIRKKIE